MSANFASISPIDQSVVWNGAESTNNQIGEVMGRAALAAESWRRVVPQRRIEIVRNYRDQLQANRGQIEALICREVGKLRGEAADEVNASIAKVELSITALEQRRGETELESTTATDAVSQRICYRPLGVTVVLGPFNFPLHLPGGQIIPALLAGNAVVFKPSEQASAIGQWMVNAWWAAGLDQALLQPIYGGASVAATAIDSPHTAAVFLTGSRAAGRAIHRRLAGRPEVLLALELGGNNPIVVTSDVAAENAAAIVSASAFATAGQRCTCARRAIFVESSQADQQINQLVELTQALRVGMPDDLPPPQLGPVVSAAAAERLAETYQRLLELGCDPLVPYQADPAHPNLLRPMIVDGTGLSAAGLDQLGDMEWFGPLLVVQRVADFNTAVGSAANTSYGLAASLLGGTREQFDQFVTGVKAGVVNWNGTTTGAAGALPFGGLGDSGNHRPAGFFAIDFCNDPIAILERTKLPDRSPWSPT